MLRQNIYEEFEAERSRQMLKWGPQSWPVVRENLVVPIAYNVSRADCIAGRHRIASEKEYKKLCDARIEDRTVSWADILLEECTEVIYAESPEDIEKELIQLGAVVVSMLEDIRAKRALQDVPEGSDKEASIKDIIQQTEKLIRASREVYIYAKKHYYDESRVYRSVSKDAAGGNNSV